MAMLYGVGVGPGDPELLTLKGWRVLQEVPVVFYPRARTDAEGMALQIARPHLNPDRQRWVPLLYPVRGATEGLPQQWRENAETIAGVLQEHPQAAFITEGDPMLYSTFIYTMEALAQVAPEVTVRVIPGVSSVLAAAAAGAQPLVRGQERMAIVSLAPEFDVSRLRQTLAEFDCVVLMKVHRALDQVLDLVEEGNLAATSLCVERVGWPEQRIHADVTALRGQRLDYFSLLIVRRSTP